MICATYNARLCHCLYNFAGTEKNNTINAREISNDKNEFTLVRHHWKRPVPPVGKRPRLRQQIHNFPHANPSAAH